MSEKRLLRDDLHPYEILLQPITENLTKEATTWLNFIGFEVPEDDQTVIAAYVDSLQASNVLDKIQWISELRQLMLDGNSTSLKIALNKYKYHPSDSDLFTVANQIVYQNDRNEQLNSTDIQEFRT